MLTLYTAEVAQRCIEMYNRQPFPGGDRAMTIFIAMFEPLDCRARVGAGGGFRGGSGRDGGRGGFDGEYGGRGGGGDRGGSSVSFLALLLNTFEATGTVAFLHLGNIRFELNMSFLTQSLSINLTGGDRGRGSGGGLCHGGGNANVIGGDKHKPY
ncbi:hypothetical protein ANCCAN_24629 [Ancylostoma caninum]|uniref:Uncharacterized protein n=1 Tax=Ancylostoma caninum TaxID=29170 RepID=A0A368FBR0_ANCCA|nr:hypothetical protein ANCCAN_24629 [Ancylostoma caninum]